MRVFTDKAGEVKYHEVLRIASKMGLIVQHEGQVGHESFFDIITDTNPRKCHGALWRK